MPKEKTKTRKTSKSPKEVENYNHEGKKRKNIPQVGLVSSVTDQLNGRTKYQHDPHIDPYLSWAGKAEGLSFDVQNVSLHIHERIDPKRIIKQFLREREEDTQKQLSLFEQPTSKFPLNKDIDFYSHEKDWTNRLIAGDSLLVMNSLIQKENMAGKVQMVYIDPPYGIKYNSNFQPFVNKKDVKDNDDADLSVEPETIKAFRDTWELGIHSYLTYLYDRLLLVEKLLSHNGSIFVQIGDLNVHFIKCLLDEIFGHENFVSLITVKKTSPLGSSYIGNVCDYILWYSKSKNNMKYRQLFAEKDFGGESRYSWVELENGSRRKMTKDEKENPSLLPKGARPFVSDKLTSTGYGKSCDYKYEFEGNAYHPIQGKSWSTHIEGMKNLERSKRLIAPASTLCYIRYYDDFPVQELSNVWTDTTTGGGTDNIYVVQTTTKILERCLLMSTDPGDLVLDITCGSGTTGFVAEQYGRRWITCDASRVAITLAKHRLMTANFPYYKLAFQNEGVKSGFEYETVPHITLKSIANKESPSYEVLYNKPIVDNSKVRVTGPFTVEAVPCLRVKPFEGLNEIIKGNGKQISQTGETANYRQWMDELKSTGVRATGNKFINFSRIEPLIATKFLHAEGEILENGNKINKVVISFGPNFGPLEQRQVEKAIEEAKALKEKPNLVIFAAFHFDPEASKDIDQIQKEIKDFTILKAQMSGDLLTADLRKKRSSNQSFWLIGEPDIEAIKNKNGTYKVKVNGFDYYNPVTGGIESGNSKKIAMWMLDTDYDERSLFPEQVFFPLQNEKLDWSKLAKSLNSEVDEEKLDVFSGTESLPFQAGENRKFAIKIIDDRGIESLVVKRLP